MGLMLWAADVCSRAAISQSVPDFFQFFHLTAWAGFLQLQ